eukprot:TRINITY_DN3253_c0_g1_i1.p1 TRINITY_DN3253_c0_g1~~TRINITY_DN3253_c0_g1_i1.p1  ORF type:complete len:446 (+),score=123.77 TRINITY_DN3253_c0_g1_i1:3-1340(+)
MFLSTLRTSLTRARLNKVALRSFGHASPNVNAKPGSAEHFMNLEHDYGCHNYHPLPVVLERGEGVFLYDVEGKRYFDFLSAYTAVSQGHCHPKIYQAMVEQGKKLTLTSRAFYTDKLGPFEKYLCETFKYDKVLLMNGGVEAGESSIKFARRWAYTVKKVPDGHATILFAKNNFWGRTIAACASSDDPDRYRGFGPFNGLNFELIDYDNPEALESMLKSNPNIAAFMVEPIQGEAGVILPKPGYLKKIRELCTKYNVLLIADEIQTGLGRTGKLLACDWENVRPDLVCLGKALSGGFYPISAVLADNHVMLNIKPGEHGSTYGGNPLACAIGRKALDVLFEEKLTENAEKMGNLLMANLRGLNKSFVKEIRGRGLLTAMEIHETDKIKAWDICIKLKGLGLLAKPTHGNIIRFAPPLIITEKQIHECTGIIKKALDAYQDDETHY